MKQNNFLDALELALSFYNGTAMAVIGNNRQLNGAVSQDLSQIQTVETATKVSETTKTAQNLKRSIENTANTKVETDGQT